MSTERTFIPIPPQDRALAGHLMALITGPVEGITREKLVTAIREIGSISPDFRLGYVTAPDGTGFIWDPTTMAATAEAMVTEESQPTPAERTTRTVELAERRSIYPLRFVVAGDAFLVAADHAYVDATQCFQVLDLVMKHLKTGELPTAPRLTKQPLRQAFGATFGTKPTPAMLQKLRGALTARVHGPQFELPELVRWVPEAGALAVGTFEPDTVRLLTRAARERGATLNALVLSAVLRRFEAEPGLQTTARATYDLRRWLPEGQQVSGNAVAALDLSSTDAKTIAAEIAASLEAGTPLLAAGVGALRARLRPGGPHAKQSVYPFGGQVRVTFSGVGVVRLLEGMPYTTKEPFYYAYTKPGSVQEVTTNLVRLKSRMYFSAAYNSSAIPAEQMQRMLDDVAGDPLRWADMVPQREISVGQVAEVAGDRELVSSL